MPTGRILDLATKSHELNEKEMPTALIYFEERMPVHDWQELFFIAVKCLYARFPDTINSLCSTDPKRILFLRTNTIGMIRPKRIASIVYLETNRTPQQILKAIRLIFSRANVNRPQMRIEVHEPIYLGNYLSKPTVEVEPPRISRSPKPVLHLNQSIEEMLSTLDAMEPYTQKKSQVVLPHATNQGLTEPQVFGNLFFVLEGERHGPFANEKNRYVALMQCLAELYPYQILKEAGRHINSEHRLTLMKGASYLYFREPVELPNNLFLDMDFPDRVLVENERYYLARCGLYFESVMFGA